MTWNLGGLQDAIFLVRKTLLTPGDWGGRSKNIPGTLSPTIIMEVENHPKWKETILLEIHPLNHWSTEPWLWEGGYYGNVLWSCKPHRWLGFFFFAFEKEGFRRGYSIYENCRCSKVKSKELRVNEIEYQGGEKYIHPTWSEKILLMIQKSKTTTVWMYTSPCKEWDKLPTSLNWFSRRRSGCHQQYLHGEVSSVL